MDKKHSYFSKFIMCCLGIGAIFFGISLVMNSVHIEAGLISYALGIFLFCNKSYYGKGMISILGGICLFVYGLCTILYIYDIDTGAFNLAWHPIWIDESPREFLVMATFISAAGMILLIYAYFHEKYNKCDTEIPVTKIESFSLRQEQVSRQSNLQHQTLKSSADKLQNRSIFAENEDFNDWQKFSMRDIDAISEIKGKKKKGDLFEQYCARLLELNFFTNVQVVGGKGDLGADIIAWKGSRKYVIQCKCYKETVPYHALEQIVTARKNVGAGEGIILTNSFFSPQTKQIAPDHQIFLWDKEKLKELIYNANMVIAN